MEGEQKVFDQNAKEDVALEQFGYQQELKRNFGILGMIGFSFSIITSWTALSGVLIVGVESGGPPVMIWSWVGLCLCTLAVAYSMAELCSAYPVAGGQYSWVVILAPKKIARGLSYICGWFLLIGALSMGAVSQYIAANFVLGMANLSYPEYTIERWHTVLLAYLICGLAMLINIFTPHLLDKLSRGILIWNITAFFVILITILACNDHKQDASFVFADFQNTTGWSAPYAAILGILQSAFGMCCYDAPSHMVEEIHEPRKQAPRAIIMSVWLGFFTGFIFLIVCCFCMGSLEETAGTSTGVPIIAIFFNSTGSVRGSCALVGLMSIIALFSSISLTAEGGRTVYAFARDHGLPFSGTLSKVNKKLHVPVYAILLTAIVQAAFDSIYFGTVTGFDTVISIATEGFYMSYALPLFVRLLSRALGHKHQALEGPWSLGRWGLLLNTVGFVYLVFAVITFNFPTKAPVTEENMNYTSAAIGVVGVIAIATWITTGRKHFTGPQTDVVVDGTEVQAQASGEEVPEKLK
ncbi:uncharacterized protein K452DRAFT_233037 [Aplosporella prunicola CBS 121167]|uniref:GABA permease n=1 Tax=Aplosporella prunicola CBS 121167 TaxID=1176127 RepID=A0A6A6B5M2_9PEZI|nr:uncharacterized protein K452DRAFT_233037 [Aplosporella prunicola CBS 121167]KAF2139156.1 hypothetical protein K452DRAFT_233037 [Aplosporella prunicola CBS 121167]